MTPKKSQIDKFKEAARELDTSENEEQFSAALRKVATAIGQFEDGPPDVEGGSKKTPKPKKG